MGGRTLQGEETIAYSTLTGDPGSGAVPAGEYNLLEDLKNQWEQLDGYSLEVSDGDLLAMANQGVSDLRTFAGQMWNTHISWGTNKPWTALGVSRAQYVATITSFGEQWQSLTGQQFDPQATPEQMPTVVWKALQAGESAAQFGASMRSNLAMQKTYGWLKYGMDYNQFQQSKLQMRGAFARDLTDAEAIPQLQYWHTTQGANQSAQATPEQMPTVVWKALQAGESAAQFGASMRSNLAMQKTYGWLKYGMDYNQFQQSKLQMRGAFARDLTDAEAIPQLQYWHTTQGANQSAQASPTFSQQEKRSAQVGPSGSVIR